jgi:hypothetical protein
MQVSFSEVARAISYTVRTTPDTPRGAVALLQAEASSGTFTVDYTDLSFSTAYTISVIATVTNSDGTTGDSETASITATTGATNFVNNVSVVDVRAASFNITYDEVASATGGYQIQILRDGALFRSISTMDTNVIVDKADAYNAEYFVSVAFITDLGTSGYSSQISSIIWNVTSVELSSISLSWTG